MAAMVDSNQKKLNSAEIIKIAFDNTKSDYPDNVGITAIVAEMKQPNTDVKQLGNTLFIMHRGDGDRAYFRALNADIAQNFVKSSNQYITDARKSGLRVLVTYFTDPAISTLFKLISKNPPMPGMGYKEYKTENGGRRIVLNLGA